MSAPDETEWSIGGDDGTDIPDVVTQYAIEPDRGYDARNHSDDIVTQIEDLPNFRNSARIIRRAITYGPWEYVPAEELQ